MKSSIQRLVGKVTFLTASLFIMTATIAEAHPGHDVLGVVHPPFHSAIEFGLLIVFVAVGIWLAIKNSR